MNKKELMYERIKKHGEKLNKIFDTGLKPVALCKKLRRLEAKAHKVTLAECNGEIDESSSISQRYSIRKSIIKALNIKPAKNSCLDDCYPVFINGDARGYALKISDDYIRENNIDIYRD